MNDQIISVRNVSKTVNGRPLLIDVSFDIEAGSLVSLIGPNGAGKTTLIKIILGIDKQYSGTTTIRATERVQYIPQLATSDPYQLPLSVHEYLSIGITPLYGGTQEKDDFKKALDHVGVQSNKLNQLYSSLSGGEKQRVAIARALLGRPTILVLDEPLTAVDYTSRTGLYELIRHLQKGHDMTVLLVSHDIESVLPLSDRVLYLNKTLQKDCAPREFITNETKHGDILRPC